MVGAALAAKPTNSIGSCSPGAKHAPVPVLNDLTYDEARKRIIAAGWKPVMTRRKSGFATDGKTELFGNAKEFWSRGYIEVADCAPTGHASCIFNWLDKGGNGLTLYTAGEEWSDHSRHATVTLVELKCRQ
jgi:hypothetical protein